MPSPVHMRGRRHYGSIIAHVVHSPPPPPANSFVIGPAVINTHPPGVTQRISVRSRASRGSFGIDTHGHRSDFCESVVFTIVFVMNARKPYGSNNWIQLLIPMVSVHS